MSEKSNVFYHPSYFGYKCSPATAAMVPITTIGIFACAEPWLLIPMAACAAYTYANTQPEYICCGNKNQQHPGCKSAVDSNSRRYHPGYMTTNTYKEHNGNLVMKKCYTCCNNLIDSDGCQDGPHPDPMGWDKQKAQQLCTVIENKRERVRQDALEKERLAREEKQRKEQEAKQRREQERKEQEEKDRIALAERIKKMTPLQYKAYQKSLADKEAQKRKEYAQFCAREKRLEREREREKEWAKRRSEYTYHEKPQRNYNSGPIHSDWVFNSNLGCDYPY